MPLSSSHRAGQNLHTSTARFSDHEKLFQVGKWLIYGLLFINFGLYLSKDVVAAQHTINAQTTAMGWLTSFAASMDQFAWVALIFIYEFETYWMDDDFDNKIIEGIMTVFKLLFAAMILNTIVAYTSLVIELKDMTAIGPAGSLCSMVDQGLSFIRNLSYTSVTSDTCGAIAHAGEIFKYPKDPVLTDTAGLREDSWYRILDVVEAAAWFAILGLTELSVRLLDRGIYAGRLTMFEKYGKYICYLILIGVSCFWLAKTQYMYVWDEFLWIASFFLLEMNMSAWRSELAEKAAAQGEADGALDLSPA